MAVFDLSRHATCICEALPFPRVQVAASYEYDRQYQWQQQAVCLPLRQAVFVVVADFAGV